MTMPCHQKAGGKIPRLLAPWQQAAVLSLAAILLPGCSHLPSPMERHASALSLAATAGWSPTLIPAGHFILQAWVPAGLERAPGAANSPGTLTVYLEGDGLAWLNESTPSSDPTPSNPLALRLALRHSGAVAYLARPCQYVQEQNQYNCQPKFWTTHRFAPEVVDATSRALDTLKRQSGARQLVLVGYSGGGAVAALVTAQRRDVARLVTVAGNLDHAAWTQLKRLTPLSGSLNPADFTPQLAPVAQWHIVGERDTVMPPAVVQGYAQRFAVSQTPRVITLAAFNHDCCWADIWTPLDPNTLIGSAFLADPLAAR